MSRIFSSSGSSKPNNNNRNGQEIGNPVAKDKKRKILENTAQVETTNGIGPDGLVLGHQPEKP